MTNKNYDKELMISRFMDNDLEDEEQRELFMVLADDKEARKTLADYMDLKKETFRHYADMNEELSPVPAEAMVLRETRQKPKGIYRWTAYVSAAAAVILLMMLGWARMDLSTGNEKYITLKKEYLKLKSDYAQAAEARQHTDGTSLKREPAKAERKGEEKHRQRKRTGAESGMAGFAERRHEANEQYAYLTRAHVVEIDKNDFLVPQIPGN